MNKVVIKILQGRVVHK